MKLLFFLGSGRAFADVEGIRYVSVCELGFAATDLCTSLVYDHTTSMDVGSGNTTSLWFAYHLLIRVCRPELVVFSNTCTHPERSPSHSRRCASFTVMQEGTGACRYQGFLV